MEPVVFKNHSGENLSGTLQRPSVANGFGFVLGHCFTCSRHTRILIDLGNALTDLGFCVLRFDFSGNGQSEGRFESSTYSKQVDEMIVAIDYMKKTEANQIFIGGHSMGGMVSLFTAAKQSDIIGVIALAVGEAPLHPDRLLTDIQKKQLFDRGSVAFSSRGRDLVLTRDFFEDAGRFDVREMIKLIRCPVLVVFGKQDTVTDPEPAKTVFRDGNQNFELFEVEDADHMFSLDEHRQVIITYVIQWIQSHFLEGR
jgi:pimeloyl-ACP methyl ester carboxylesterase